MDHWSQASERVWESDHIHLQRAVRRHKTFGDSRRASPPHTNLERRSGCPPRVCVSASPLYWSVQDTEADKLSHLRTPTATQVPNSPHLFYVSLLKRFSLSAPGPTEPEEPPLPEILDQPSIYQVWDILDSR